MIFLLIFSIYSKSSIIFGTPGEYPFTLAAGEHFIECYGAQGGSGYDGDKIKSSGGNGAYVSGVLTITGSSKNFFAFVGGEGGSGAQGPNNGGSNGGGKGGADTGPIDKNDASGGGGGASDIRYNDKYYTSRVMVAAGGSGGARFCNGAPGGDINGYYAASDNNYLPDSRVNQKNGDLEGKGQDGKKSIYTSGSGSGGGWRGGFASDFSTASIPGKGDSYKYVATSGSSYISGEPECSPHPEIIFSMRNMQKGNNTGEGKIIITTNFNCSENCFSCSSEEVCTKCFDNYKLYNNACIQSCPSGYIELNNKCEPCQSPCRLCTESTTKCTSCIDGFLYENKCVKYCPDGFVGIGKECKRCDLACKICDGTASNCFECADNYLLHNNQCVSECPEGTVRSGKVCENCQPTCKTCYGTSDHCTSCHENFYLNNGNCVTSCPNKMYGKDGQCVSCKPPCETCESNDKCITCNDGFYLYEGQCLVDCPPGTNKSGSKCL